MDPTLIAKSLLHLKQTRITVTYCVANRRSTKTPVGKWADPMVIATKTTTK